MTQSKNCNGAALSVVGTAIAITISEKVTVDEANILGALFNVIGDQLSLIAATEVSNGNNSDTTSNTQSK